MSFDASALPGWVTDEKVPGLAHADGVAWWATPVPRRWWHRCRVRRWSALLAAVVVAAGCSIPPQHDLDVVTPPASPTSTTVEHVTGWPYPTHCTMRQDAGHALPDPVCTPGDAFPGVTRAQVCTPGWSRAHRAPIAETDQVKRAARVAYGLPAGTTGEGDHLVSLELGGSNDVRNLWLEPGPIPNVKDRLENRLHALVCAGGLDLVVAQRAITDDWVTAYLRYVGPLPKQSEGTR